MTDNNDMVDNVPITVNKTVNIWSVIPAVAGLVVTAFGWGVTYNSMNSADERAKEQIERLSEDVKDVRSYVPQISQLNYQMSRAVEQLAESKASNVETNKRIDRVIESFGGKLDTLVDSVNKIATRVEVLTTQMKEKAQPTSYNLKKGL